MVEKVTPSRVVFNIVNYGFMIFFTLICIVPLWHVVMASVSDPRLLMSHSWIVWWPLGNATWGGYELVLKNPSILMGYGNTIIYAVWNAVGGTFCTDRKSVV